MSSIILTIASTSHYCSTGTDCCHAASTSLLSPLTPTLFSSCKLVSFSSSPQSLYNSFLTISFTSLIPPLVHTTTAISSLCLPLPLPLPPAPCPPLLASLFKVLPHSSLPGQTNGAVGHGLTFFAQSAQFNTDLLSCCGKGTYTHTRVRMRTHTHTHGGLGHTT